MVYSPLSNAAASPWRKLFLVLLWVGQLALLPPYIIIIAMLVGIARVSDLMIARLNIFNVVIEIIALCLICTEIHMYSYSELRPKTFLIFNIIKLLFGLASSGIGFYGSVVFDRTGSGFYTWIYILVATGFSVALCISLFVTLMYSIIIASRSRKKMNGLIRKYDNGRPFG
ncbi:hypothetical protein HYFRA_00005439 [Hymenoscyphus fraxineus]|uniref:Uncharacterized protein n=1 Tax=Hymenoscyphus fraxineus TaxID=746836 RepID=A0A9N9KQJ2_9HELO|nr:hypothetical protein HYFRA_00005439 [Hymenoscyphus fraxineus]